MALLATIMALAAPSLVRSFRGRTLDQEATRLLALTEYARDEAASQGVPMTVWIDEENRRVGVEAKAGFVGNAHRRKDFALHDDVHFDKLEIAAALGLARAVEFAPDGTLDPASIASMRLVDRFDSGIVVQMTADKMGYEIVKEAAQK